MSSSRGEGRGVATTDGWRIVAPGDSARREYRFRPVLVLRVALGLMLVGELGRIPILSLGTTEAPLLVNDIWVMIVLVVGALAAIHSRSFRIDRVGGAALLFASLGGVMALLAVPRFGLTGFQLVVSLAYLARWLVYFGLYLVVINVVRSDDVMDVWRILEAMMLAFALFGIIQAIFLPHFAQLVYPESRVGVDWDEQGHRLVSTMLEPNIAGAMIVIVLLVELAQLAAGERIALWKPTLMVAALLASLSRSSFLALMVGGVIILAIRGVSRRMLWFGTLLVLLLVPVVPRILQFAQQYNKLGVSDPSAMSRVAAWFRILDVLSDNKLFGIGFNTYRFVQVRYGYTPAAGLSASSADGGLLFITLMTGFVGVALYIGMLWLIVRRCRAVWRDSRVERGRQALAVGIAAATVAVCVHSLFANSLLTPFVMEPLWTLWGLVFVLACAREPHVPADQVATITALRLAS